ncbi:nucleotide pyrophosphohydrolase [Flavobacterium jejuense]|uniref:Nucleotide pyrophosphohydrolase n=1 Tax=Flavobacterium jejuense TaxID=1544455 RepID=A0ABX0IS60_9FLAO|nr:nucleotide pyrophosphohydrolase [Flavobacterium jejuense]NHN24956.1 nucleotide pyrophosphohydrolase [Flavobacterium jejuense]
MEEYKKVIEELIKFRNDRDWEQFHDSKNLALAISIEAAELNELFLWKKDNETENVKIEKLKEELADVLSFSFLLAEKHNLNIFDIVLEKIKQNAEKYPVDKAKGTAKKYNEL